MRLFDEYAYMSFYLKSVDNGKKGTVDKLFKKYHSIEQILQRSYDELEEIAGAQGAFLLTLLGQVTSRRFTDEIKVGTTCSSDDIERYVRWMYFGLSSERIYLILLDGKGRYIETLRISEGTVSMSEFVPRRVIELVSKCKSNPKYAVLAHNHPGGTCDPSKSDEFATDVMKATLKGLGVELVGHYVVAGRDIEKIEVLPRDRT